MKIALVPGSFDPITTGHMNIIKRATQMFDLVYVTVFINANKTARFSIDDRLEMIKAACAGYENIICDKNSGMLADYCKEKNICTVVKGVRNSIDFEYEKDMAEFNRGRNPRLDTVLLPAYSEFKDISSTKLCELLKEGSDCKKYIPSETIDIINRLLKEKKASI